jgi:hypothetical protein
MAILSLSYGLYYPKPSIANKFLAAVFDPDREDYRHDRDVFYVRAWWRINAHTLA